MSGVILTDADTAAATAERARVLAERQARRDDPKNPRVFFDVEINGKPAGRVRGVPSRSRLRCTRFVHVPSSAPNNISRYPPSTLCNALHKKTNHTTTRRWSSSCT